MLAQMPPVFQKRLDPHERVLWWGRPKPGILFRQEDWFTVPFSIAWCGIVLAQLAAADDPSGFFALVLFSFLAIGLYMLVGRFILDAWRRSRTFYALTPTRALIVTRQSMKSVELRGQSEITLRESSGGSGSIIFGPETFRTSEGDTKSQWNGEPIAPTFEGIPDARGVYSMIRQAQANLVPAR